MKIRTAFLSGLAVLIFTANAHAVTITYATVVQADTVSQKSASVGSSDAAEEAWAEGFIGPATYVKFDIGGSAWMAVDGDPGGTNLFAFDFGASGPGSNPTHFIVKTGDLGGPTDFRHFLFTNLNSLRYGVVDLNNFGGTGLNIGIDKISHSAALNGTARVPDGGTTLMLLGAAMGALGIARRRFGRS